MVVKLYLFYQNFSSRLFSHLFLQHVRRLTLEIPARSSFLVHTKLSIVNCSQKPASVIFTIKFFKSLNIYGNASGSFNLLVLLYAFATTYRNSETFVIVLQDLKPLMNKITLLSVAYNRHRTTFILV